MNRFTEKDKEKVIELLVGMTNDLAHPDGSDTLVERLYALLDLPCEICKDGEVIREQSRKIERLSALLRNAFTWIDEENAGFFDREKIDTAEWCEYTIGITAEEYAEVFGR